MTRDILRPAARLAAVLTLTAALSLVGPGCDKNKTDAIVLVNQGVKALDRGDIGTARAHFGRAARLDPNNAAAHYHLGLVMLYHADEPAQALIHYETAQRLSPGDVETLYQLGRLLVLQDDAQGAIAHLDQATKLDPNHAGAWHYKGKALRKLERAVDADTALRESITIDPTLNRSYLALGDLYESVSALDAAKAVYSEGLHHRPRDPDLLNGLGVLALRQSKTDKAIEHLTEALSRDGNRIDTTFNLAFAYAEKGDARLAITHLNHYMSSADPVAEKTNLRVARALKDALQAEVVP